MMLPWAIALDVEYTGQHAYNVVENVNINARRLRRRVSVRQPGSDADHRRRPGAAAVQADQMRAFRGFSIDHAAQARGYLDATRCRCR